MLDLDKLSKILKDSITQESVRKFFEEKEQEEELYASQAERFYQKHKDNMPIIIEKIIDKYDSDKYVRKEYKLGYQPREDLYWVLESIASKYGEKVELNKENAEKYPLNMFTGSAYTFEGYLFQVMHGQGSVVRIDQL
jgi:hypothetical protein